MSRRFNRHSNNDILDADHINELQEALEEDYLRLEGKAEIGHHHDGTYVKVGEVVESVNGKTGDVVLTAEDIGAAAANHQHSGNGLASVALGPLAKAPGEGAVTVGTNSDAAGDVSVVVGTTSQSSGLGAVAIGGSAKASGRGSVALGPLAVSEVDSAMVVSARSLRLEPIDMDQLVPSLEAGSIQMYNEAGKLSSIGIDANDNLTVDGDPIAGGGIASIVAGDNITVDSSDPANPVVSAAVGSGGSGIVTALVNVGTVGPDREVEVRVVLPGVGDNSHVVTASVSSAYFHNLAVTRISPGDFAGEYLVTVRNFQTGQTGTSGAKIAVAAIPVL